METKKRDRTKIAVIVLAVLLALSICALAVTVVLGRIGKSKNVTVSVPNNLITPDEEGKINTNSKSAILRTASEGVTDKIETSLDGIVPDGTVAGEIKKRAVSISLHSRQPEDNITFSVKNFFPGDVETKYYRVQVAYHGKVAVNFKAVVRDGYEILSSVLKVKIKLLSTGEVLYDGKIGDMPEKITHTLTSQTSTSDELYYEITAALDTSVGNEYQNRTLIADFGWWVEETDNLDRVPQTGDVVVALTTAIAFAVGMIFVLFIVFGRKKEEDKENA